MTHSVDEPIEFSAYDPRWPAWFADDSAELRLKLGHRVRALEHFGSTAVVGLAAKPIIDILVAPVEWPLATVDRDAIATLGYEFLGEAGVPGREYFRRRAEHATNLAVVQFAGTHWRSNIALRDYLRAHPEIAARYADVKLQAWQDGARTLLSYSTHKGAFVSALVADAVRWSAMRKSE